jgi:hypothetical protein
VLVLKNELGSQAVLNRVELYSTHASQATGLFYNVSVLMCETDVSSLSTSFNANYGGGVPLEVFMLDTLSIDWTHASPGWNGFDLDTPFQYSGSGNLIVEFRYLGHNGKTVNARAASLPSADRCLSGGYPTSTTGQLMSFLTCMRLHHGSSGLEGTSFAKVKAFFTIP